MAPKKKKYSELSESARWYRDNPDGRRKKASTDKKINERPDQEAKRRELGKKRYADEKKGKNLEGLDFDHLKKKYMPASKNRGQAEKSRLKGSKRK